jgi:hypothetical protein
MRRVILALLGLFLAAGLGMAQNWQARHQIGAATQEIKTEGLSAAHSRIPIGSKAKVTNPANGLEIEVTIIAAIPESPSRIIDLSPSAARALDINSGAPVIVASLSQQTPPAPGNSASPSSDVEVQMGKQPFNITINNYIINSRKQDAPENNPGKSVPPENGQEYPVTKDRYEPEYPVTKDRYEPEYPVSKDRYEPEIMTVSDIPNNTAKAPNTAAELPVTPPARPPAEELPVSTAAAQAPAQPAVQPETPPAALPEKEPFYTAPPVYDPQIIPGLPNPDTDKVYRLLVGTYPGVDSAFRIYQQLQAAGFDVVQEQAGDMCKVFAAGIPASRVYYAAKRLGAIGFSQIWIQE